MEHESAKPMFSKRALAALMGPLIVEQFLMTAVGMADTLMIASVGEKAVSAVSIVNYVNNLVVMLISALATGGAVVVAQYIGHEEVHNGRVAAKQLLYTVTGVMILLAVAVVFLRGGILSLIYGSLDQEILTDAKLYFLITGLSFPFLGLYNSCAALFRAMGNSRVSMNASLVMNVVNVIGNAILIYGCKMGVAGAAIPTLVSRIVAAAIVLILIQRQSNVIYLEHPFRYRPNFDMIRRILKVGIPSGIENSIFQIGKLFIQSLVASLGTASLAANSILDSLWGITMVPAQAVNLALITVVGQCVGAGRFREAKRYTWGLILTGAAVLVVTGAPTIPFANQIIGLFNLGPEANAICVRLYWMMIVTDTLLWPLSFGIPNALRAAGDARYTMTVAIISMWVWRVGFCYIFIRVFHMGLEGSWYAMFMDWMFRILLFTKRFSGETWQKKSVIAGAAAEAEA